MLDLAYCAGFFDGEGSVHVNKRRGQNGSALFVTACNSNREVIEMLHKQFGGSMHVKQPPFGRNWKQIYRWNVHADRGAAFLADVLPYLVVKREHAEVGLRFQALKSGENNMQGSNGTHPRRNEILAARDECARALALLNAKGAVAQ